MTIFYSFLKAWWKEIFIVLVVLGAVAYVRDLQLTVERQAVTIAQMDIIKNTLIQSNETLTATIKQNSQALAELSEGADFTKEEFAKLNGRVASQTQEIADRLKGILNKPVPVTCEDTIDYMIDAAPTYGLHGKVSK